MDLRGGWVTCQGEAQCTESAETVDKSLPPAHQKKKRNLSPTTHEGEGRKHPQSGWCMVWTVDWDWGFNREKGRKWKGGGGSCLNYADVGRNRSRKPTKSMAASMEQAQITRLLSFGPHECWQLGNGGGENLYLDRTWHMYSSLLSVI